ncbi:MAG: acetyl/propionyl-CoA carboxylase subuit alpha [Myxococcales bacterium]
MSTITKILVANRGEIAIRVMRTCRELGIATVAVFSDADAGAAHVRAADEAVRIGPAPASESYLVTARLLDAARRTGADAIHPGYGFLSENAVFAEAVEGSGLVFIGPRPDSIRAMGSKAEAKRLMAAAGVPVIPGWHGEEQETGALVQRAREVGFPLLVKASAGGGGKGMRLVRDAAHLERDLDAARREAEKAFGDGTLLLERYIEDPRHIEFQILGDSHGNLVHLFERECSIQRRHQKIVEETPSVALTPALRARMGEVAVAAGRAIRYRGAGTVEMILAPGGEFYFLEVNTRLQVEHPVTELVTGIDLVREQIRVARGELLGYGQESLLQTGAAVEARIYAEDPATGFLPAAGSIVDWHFPPAPGLRVDAGVETGSEVGIWYDPMLAKVIAHGRDRQEATARLARALEQASILGVTTNQAFLVSLLRHPEYLAGHVDTHFIDRHWGPQPALPHDGERLRQATIAAAVAGCLDRRATRLLPALPAGWRNNASQRQTVSYSAGGATLDVAYEDRGAALRVRVGDTDADVRVIDHAAPSLTLEVDGVRRTMRVVRDGARVWVHALGSAVALEEVPRFPEGADHEAAGGCHAPMPGKVLRVFVAEGDVVAAGQTVVTLEAMKMEHAVTAPVAAVVARVLVQAGDQVDADAPLVELEPVDAGGTGT